MKSLSPSEESEIVLGLFRSRESQKTDEGSGDSQSKLGLWQGEGKRV